MAEETYSWTAGAPITAEKMNRLQRDAEEVEVAHRKDVSKDTLQKRFADVEATANTAATTASDVSERIQTINSNSALGAKAWDQMVELVTENGNEKERYLTTRILGTESTLASTEARLTNVEAQLDSARRPGKKPEDSLALRFHDIDATMTNLSTSLNSTITSVADINRTLTNTAQGETPYQGAGDSPYADTLARRFYKDEEKLKAVETQLDDAKTSTAYNLANLTLDSRFERSEEEIVGARTSEARNTSYDSLDARFEANESEIMDAHSSTAKNSNFNSLDARFESIEDELVTARGGLSTVDARLDTIEENATALTNHVNTDFVQNSRIIPNLAATVAGNVLDATQGRILNERLTTAESGLETTTSGLATANGEIDALKTRMNAVDNSETGSIAALYDELDAENSGVKARISTLENSVNHESTGLTARMNAAETNINNISTTLNTTTGVANQAASDITTLNTRITALEGATVVVTELPDVGDATKDYLLGPNSDGKYFYYKWINNEWNLISGGESGTGTSSAAFAADFSQITDPDINTDYYVGNNTDGYLHYRYIEQENSDQLRRVLIGTAPDNIKRYNIQKVQGKKREFNTETQEWEETDEDTYYLNLYEFDYGVSNAQSSIEETMIPVGQIELPQGGGGGGTISTAPRVVRITPSNITTVQNEDHIYLRFFYAAVDATGESIDGTYTLKYNNGSIISSGPLNSGAYDQSVTTGVWPSAPRPVGFYEIDVTEYCRLGTQTFNLVVTVNGQDIPRIWTINILELKLESSAPQSQLIEVGNTIRFPYTPYGAMPKTLYVQIDGTTVNTQSLNAAVSGTELEIEIPSQAHGAHEVSIYLEAILDGEAITTPVINRDYIWYDASQDEQVILASSYRYATTNILTDWAEWTANTSYSVGDKVKITSGSSVIGYICKRANTDATFNVNNWNAQVINSQQYGEIEIPYTVYNSEASVSTVKYYVNNKLLDTVSVTNSGVLTYTFEEFGDKKIRIEVGNVNLDFNVAVKKIAVDIAPVPNPVINFDPATLTNASANRLPSWTYNDTTYHMTVSDNFNWSNDMSGGGYKEDVDGKCFVIKAGTYAEFDYKMFKMAVDNSDPEHPVYTSAAFDNGAEMKIIFKVAAVRDASAVWFSNVGNPSSNDPMPIGIQLKAHEGWLKTSAADAAEKQAQRDGTTVSTNAYLYFPYSEEDKIELDININKIGNREDFIMSYEDGVPSKAYAYEPSEILYHADGNESVIHIGSPDCDVYIYKLRIYDKGLGTSDILRNFIADGKTVADKINRYNRNSIYYDSTKPEGQKFTPYKVGNAVLDPEKLAEKMPDVKILMLEADTFTKDKNTFVNSSLRCIHADGGKIYPSRGDEDNWLFRNGLHSGQGTTSDKYGQASRNVDFLFMCDGRHAPTKKKNITNDQISLVSTLVKGKDKSVFNPTTKSWTPTVDAVVETCSGWQNDDAKVSLTATSVPNNYFNLKVNVASSENVNNALFQKRYNDFLRYVYESPAYKRDNRIKNDMEFVPAILFIRETNPTKDENGNYTNHLEFNDTNWHFYSLGNIGDSKKTDYTRAYDPTDMNEFTVEISDNNTPNSQFQSGVYKSNNERIIEESDSGIINSMNYIWDIDMDTEWNAMRDPTEKEIEHDAQVAAKKDKYLDGTDLENPKTNYILPNGKVYVNYRHRMLSGDPFDGKHSFEFRYACKGDYRDGDLINDTNGKIEINGSQVSRDEYQFGINRQVVEAFYTWVVTSSDEEFKQHLSEWCVPEAVEFFYAFTHFYTMMDNRAKNCFWHFGKTGTHRQVHTPYKELLHVYDELQEDGSYKPTTDTEIDSKKTYYTEYAFDLWAYDMDTAAGIDNNGELVFPYGKEDTDYRQAGISSSGYVFNGAGSIIWRRLSTSFTDEIADIFNRVNEAACFDAMNLINQFDTFQSCYPEEMWRLDIERKYIRTFTGKVYDNCKLADTGGNTKQNTRFLKEMMQGRKKYQRRQWVRDQAIYFGSKYMLNNIRNNTIEMVCYTPDAPLWNSKGYEYKENDVTYYRPFVAGDFTFYGSENNRKLYKCIEGNADSTFVASKWAESVTPDYKLKLVPYQDMYLNVAVGNGNLRTPVRAVAGQEYTIDCTANMNETRVYIYAGSYIQAISGLAPFYIGANIFSSAARLKKLDLGTDNPYYHNTNLKTLTILPNMPILEELNIKNCDSLNTPINLSESNNLKIVEAEGSMIPSISLPAYSSIETLHLPSTVNTLNLQSARNLDSFYMKNKETGEEDYSSLLSMNIGDSDYSDNIDWLEIAASTLQHLNSLYLTNLNKASITNITELEKFADRKKELETQYDAQGNLINKVNFTGIINVNGSWSEIERDSYAGTPTSIWPKLNLNTKGTEQVKRKYIFRYNGKEYITYITVNNSVPDPYAINEIELPTQASDPRYNYVFGSINPNSGKYIPYSGWKYINSDTPLGSAPVAPAPPSTGNPPIILEPFFTGVARKYTIRWFLDTQRTQLVGERSEIPYGGGEDVSIPTVQNIHEGNYMNSVELYGKYETCTDVSVDANSNVQYRLFTGWDKLPINIQPDGLTDYYDIFAVWDNVSTSAGDVFKNVVDHQLTPIQLLVLASMPDNVRANYNQYDEAYQTTIQLGHDSTQEGTTIVSDTGDALRLTGTNDYEDEAYSTNFQPFKDKAFTFVIDYTFSDIEEKANTYSILASCYHSANNVVHGFGIFKNNTENRIEVGFGDMYNNANNRVIVNSSGNVNMRNIVVLRHPAVKVGDEYEFLYVYSSQGSANSIAANKAEVIAMRRPANVNFTSDAYLNIGQLFDSNRESVQDGEVVTNRIHAKAKIHWSKYWNYDIGAGECEQIASWPHEQITLGIASLATPTSTVTGVSGARAVAEPLPTLYLATLSTPTHGIYASGQIQTSNFNPTFNSYSWRDMTLRTIYNNRIFNALPFELQAVLMKPGVNSYQAIYETGADGQGYSDTYKLAGQAYKTRDYVYAYSAANVLDDESRYENEDELLSPFTWKSPTKVEVYNYSTTNGWQPIQNENSNYLNIRFPYKPISWGESNKMHVYVIDQLDTISGSVAASIGASKLRSGDIFISNHQAYIYISNKEINRYGLYIVTDNKFVGLSDNDVANIKTYSTNLGLGGWIKSTAYWTRSLITGTTRVNIASVSTEGIPDVSNTSNSVVARNFNFIIAL